MIVWLFLLSIFNDYYFNVFCFVFFSFFSASWIFFCMPYCFYSNNALHTMRTPNVIPTREEKVGVINTHATCKIEKPKRERQKERASAIE